MGMSNDTFKFRVWDTVNKCFQQEDADDCFIRQNGDMTCVFWGDCDTMPTEFVKEEDAIIDMCIGLKDKTGMFVYCGDILKDAESLWEVCWSQSIASFMLDEYSYDENGEYTGSGNLQTIHADEISEMEIVGNIHEGVWKQVAKQAESEVQK